MKDDNLYDYMAPVHPISIGSEVLVWVLLGLLLWSAILTGGWFLVRLFS